MKHLLISLMTLFSLSIYGQDKIYVHTVTAANTTGHITTIDHPDLNGHPNAGIVYKHVWNPNGTVGVYNDKIDGLWYSSGHWKIYNEDRTPMKLGAKFFVYIASNPNRVITHVADAAHTGTLSRYTEIDNSSFNNHNPGPYAAMSNFYNPHGVYNPHNYGFYYDITSNKRNIYSEDHEDIPLNAAFKILKYGDGTGVSSFTHTTTAANVTGNVTIINNTILNNNPNAAFVFAHYWGVDGTASTRVLVTHKISAFYATGVHKWALYTEDHSAFPVGAAFDIIIAPQDTTSAVDEVSDNQKIGIYPNPVKDILKITTQKNIKTLHIFNTLGQELKNVSVSGDTNLVQIPVNQLPQGTYILNIEYQDGNTGTTKFLK